MEYQLNLQPPPQYTPPQYIPPSMNNVEGDNNGGSLHLLAEVSTSLVPNTQQSVQAVNQSWPNNSPAPPSYPTNLVLQLKKPVEIPKKRGAGRPAKSQVGANMKTLLPAIRHLAPKPNSAKAGAQKALKSQKQIPKLMVLPINQRGMESFARAQTQGISVGANSQSQNCNQLFPGCRCPACVSEAPRDQGTGFNYPLRPPVPMLTVTQQWNVNLNSRAPVASIPANAQQATAQEIPVPRPQGFRFPMRPQFPQPMNLVTRNRTARDAPQDLTTAFQNMWPKHEQPIALTPTYYQHKPLPIDPRTIPQFDYKVPVLFPASAANQYIVFSNGNYATGNFVCEICSFITASKAHMSDHRYEHPDQMLTFIEIDPNNPLKILSRRKCDYIPVIAARLSKSKVI